MAYMRRIKEPRRLFEYVRVRSSNTYDSINSSVDLNQLIKLKSTEICGKGVYCNFTYKMKTFNAKTEII